MINWQLSNRVSADQYHLTVPRAQVSSHWGRVFFEVIRWQITSFKWSQAQVYFFQWFIWNMLCLCHYGPALLRFWFQTDLGRENSASFFKNFRRGRPFLTMATRWSRSTSNFYALIGQYWQVSSCGKFTQHLENCLLWQLKLTEFCVNFSDVLTVFFLWMCKMKYSCYQEPSVIHGWFVN